MARLVWLLGLRVYGLGLRAYGIGFRVQGVGLKSLRLGVEGLGFKAKTLRSQLAGTDPKPALKKSNRKVGIIKKGHYSFLHML